MAGNSSDGFGDLLRRYRQEAGLTQEQLAERANLSVRAISELERGARQHPYRATILLLARALALSDDQFSAFEQAGRRPSAAQPADTAANRVEHQHNLPAQLTSFVGRAAELARGHELLFDPAVRLLTITGPPGTGKTRFSLEVGASLLAEFRDGVFAVELAPIREPALVAPAIAATLAVRESANGSFVDGLKQFLADKQMLLLLDNFEQVLDAGPLLIELLRACPQLKALVTSREALRLRGEKEFPLPPLAAPVAGMLPPLERLGRYEAVQLFVDRARDKRPHFALTQENAPAVVEICRRLDGLPLAIELAAARSRIFSPQALLDRLDDRLALLIGGDKDLPARQQTLRAAIGWSYELLGAQEQTLFSQLAIFAGGCTLESIAAVCDQTDVAELVESLVGKSLLQQRQGFGYEPRFALLEMIREYAAEKLTRSGTREPLNRSHARYFMLLAEQATLDLLGPQPQQWLGKMDDEHDNMRAALHWALPSDATAPPENQEIGLRICAALWPYWEAKGHISEGRHWLEAALRFEEHTTRADRGQALLDRGRALVGAASLAIHHTDLTVSRALFAESLSIFRQLDDRRWLLIALAFAGDPAGRQGDYAESWAFYLEALALSRELGDKHFTAHLLGQMGQRAAVDGDLAAARAYYAEGMAISQEIGDKPELAQILLFVGELTYHFDLAEARGYLEDSLRYYRELDTRWGIALALRNLASVALALDELARAGDLCVEGLVIVWGMRERRAIAHCLAIMAGIAARSGSAARRAATLVGATEGVMAQLTTRLWIIQQRDCDHAADTAREQLGDEQFEAARRTGMAMTLEQAVFYALETERG